MAFKLLKIAGGYLALSLVFGLIALGLLYPDVPATPHEWLKLFLLSLPAWLAVEAFGHALWNNRIARRVDEGTRAKSFSLARIAYGVVAVLLSIGIVGGVIYGWGVLRG